MVTIEGPLSDLCPGPGVIVRQKLKKVDLQGDPPIFSYAIYIEYSIELENIGTVDQEITEMIDPLPVGIGYVAHTCASRMPRFKRNSSSVLRENR